MKFLHNYWYVAAWAKELEPGKLLARTFLNEPVVLFRTPDGTPHAFEDRCCHRRAPLSLGRMIGDKVQCGYHGLVYTAEGKVVGIPGQTMVPPGAQVRTYPIVERHAQIWIWMGDEAQADPAKIPDHLYYMQDDPKWRRVDGYLHVKCNYFLLVDNLLDLTHETFLHGKTIGNDHVANTPLAKVDRDDKGVTATRWMLDIDPPPLYARAGGFDKPGIKVDRWQFIRFEPPSHVTLDVGVAAAGTGAPQGNRSQGITHAVCDAITPETETTTHYFWSFPRNYKLDDKAVHEFLQKGIYNTFLEDIAMLEGQQRIMDAAPEAAQIDINADGASIQARRMMDRLLAEEADAAPSRAAAAE